MKHRLPGLLTMAGLGFLLTCPCATSRTFSKLSTAFGFPIGARSFHSLTLGLGAALILSGLWFRSRKAACIGLGAFLLLALAEIGVPPSFGTRPRPIVYSQPEIAGLFVFILSAAVLAAALNTAYALRPRVAGAVTMCGAVAACGCSCTTYLSSLNALLITFVPAFANYSTDPLWALLPVALMGSGLAVAGGWRPAAILLAGEAMVYWGPRSVKYVLTGPVFVSGVEINVFFRYSMAWMGIMIAYVAIAVALRRQEMQLQPDKKYEEALAATFRG